MIDYFLRFTSRIEAISELSSSGMIGMDAPISVSNHNFAIDEVGLVARAAGEDESAVFQSVIGYHVNIRMIIGELPDSLLQFCVNPNTPARVFG